MTEDIPKKLFKLTTWYYLGPSKHCQDVRVFRRREKILHCDRVKLKFFLILIEYAKEVSSSMKS